MATALHANLIECAGIPAAPTVAGVRPEIDTSSAHARVHAGASTYPAKTGHTHGARAPAGATVLRIREQVHASILKNVCGISGTPSYASNV